MLTIEAIRAALRSAVDAPVAPVAAIVGDVASLAYVSADVCSARVSDDVEALREVAGHVVAASWTDAATPLVVYLRYAPAPVVEAPRPIAPAPVPASPHRRR